MIISISKDKVLDTIESKIIDRSSVQKIDLEILNDSIIFNINGSGDNRNCSFYSSKKGIILSTAPYNRLKEKLDAKGTPYQEINIEQETKTELKATLEFFAKLLKISKIEAKTRLEINRDSATQVKDNKDLYSKDLSKEERERIRQENEDRLTKELEKRGRYIDPDFSKLVGDKAKSASLMISDAMKVLKDNYRFYYEIINDLNEHYLTEEESKGYGIETMAVSINTIYYYPDFVLSCSVKELVFILAHEALHIALTHLARAISGNHDVWNIAADIIVNNILSEEMNTTPSKAGYDAEFAKGAIYFPQFNTEVETMESVYNKLIEAYPDLQKLINDLFTRLNEGDEGGSSGESEELSIDDRIKVLEEQAQLEEDESLKQEVLSKLKEIKEKYSKVKGEV